MIASPNPGRGRKLQPSAFQMLFLLIAAVSLAGCMAGYGSIVTSPDALVILADHDHLSAYQLYVFGDPDNPAALVGLVDGYRMDSDVWKPVVPGVLQRERITHYGYRKGYDILAPDGKTVGIMASNLRKYSVKVDANARIVTLAPYARGNW